MTPGLAEDIARSRILDAIRAEFGDYELLEETPSAEEADGAVTLTLRVRMLADIGKMVPYEGEPWSRTARLVQIHRKNSEKFVELMYKILF